MPGREDHHSPDNSQSSEPIHSDGSLSASSLSANVASPPAFTTTPITAAQNQNTGNTAPGASVNSSCNDATAPNASSLGTNSLSAMSRVPPASQDEPDCLLDVIAHAVSFHSDPTEESYQRSNVSSATASPDNPPSYHELAVPDLNQSDTVRAGVSQADPPHYKSLQNQATLGTTSSWPKANHAKKAAKAGSLRISTHLVRASKRLLDFLACVDAHPELYSGQAVVNAIHRYEYLWLPLLSDHHKKNKGGPEIAPPLDVHWIWVVHMLAPQHYKVECEAITGMMLPHRLLTQNSLAIARARGRSLWEAVYPHDPWELDYQNLKKIIARAPSKIHYDLIKAVGRQCAFYYQVSLAHYRTSSFLHPAVQRYRKFVQLKKLEPKTFLVPCYDMDLVWHAHQLHPVSYYNDTTSFLGCLLPHDDSVNNREAGSKLVVSDGITRQLWKDAWREDFARNGGMYRGDPPNMYISHPLPQLKRLSCVPIFNVSFTKIKFKGKFPEGALKIKFRHQVHPLGDLTVQHDSSTDEHDISSAGLSLSLPNHLVQKWLVIKVAPERALGKLLSKLGHGRFWCMRDLSELVMCKSGDTLVKEFSEEGLRVEVTLKVERKTTPVWVSMSTLTGPFRPINVPVIKLTSQTGMSVCAKHLSDDDVVATTVQPSAPQLSALSPPQNLGNVDATSLQNLLNAGGLANTSPGKKSSEEEHIVQLEGSPYLYKRKMDSNLRSSSQEQVKASGEASLAAPEASVSAEELETFKVHMATHRIFCVVIKVAPERALGKLLSKLGHGRFWLMNTCHPDKPQLFKVEVSHSRSLLLSTVHVYSACDVLPWAFDDTGPESRTPQLEKELSAQRLVALAHTLDPNTLPSPQMLKMTNTKWQTSHIAMCDWDAGERAMIVKGAGGKDWAILIARWTGLRRGIPGTLSRRGVPGSCGELSLRLHCPVNSPAEQISLPYSKSKFDFQVRSCWIDLSNGTVLVKAEEEEFIEHITLGFAITVLHVLCQPRMENMDATDSSSTVTPVVPDNLPNRIPVERLSLLTAAGFFCLVAPTNQYRRQMSQGAMEAGRYKRTRQFSTTACDYPLLLPMMATAYEAGDAGHDVIEESGVDDGFMGACGACGGCGGCGGGVAAVLGQRPQYLWGNSQSGANADDGGFAEAGYGDGSGGLDAVIGTDVAIALHPSWVNNRGGIDCSPFSGLFGSSSGDAGGGNGGDGDGGGCDGGGCDGGGGGCGGCGGGCGGCGC